MKRSGISRNIVLVAGYVVLVYASLAAMANSCAFSHIDISSSHVHHGSQEAAPHSALCAWACQATSDAGLVTEPPLLSTGPVARLMVSFPNRFIPSLSSLLLHSRAPPSVPFVHIG